MQQISRRTPMPKCHLSAWVFSCKSATYFQNAFSQENLWVAASVPINGFKVLARFSGISFLSFIFQYIFRKAFPSNKVFHFSQVNVFIACHLSKIDIQSERRALFYFPQNIRFFVSKTSNFLFRKKRFSLKIAVPDFQKDKKITFRKILKK